MSAHTRDAGDLGCGDGLAAWFRTQLRDLPAGDTLHSIVRDPVAREEIPAMARPMGARAAQPDFATVADELIEGSASSRTSHIGIADAHAKIAELEAFTADLEGSPTPTR